MIRFILSVLFVLFAVTSAQAQTPTLHFEYLNTTPAIINAYTRFIRLNNVLVSTPATCVARGQDTTCSVPLPALATGTNTIQLVDTFQGMSNEATITFNPATRPVPIANPSVKFIIVITFPPQ